MRHQRLHAAELGRARNGFLKTPAESLLALLQEIADAHARVVLDVGVVLEFVRHDVQHGELPVGFLRHRDRIFQRVQ